MKRLSLLTLSACLVTLCTAVSSVHADLDADVQAVLADKLLHKGAVGVEIIRLGDKAGAEQSVFSHNGDKPLIPASNLKLVTTAAALERLGPAFKFKTQLALTPDHDVLLVGDGDPVMGDAEYLKKVGWTTTTQFEWWATRLREQHGIRSVRDVIVDDSVFETETLHPHWPTDQIHKRYVPEVAGVNLNVNCVDFIVQALSPGQTVAFQMDPRTRYVTVRNTCVGGSENRIWLSREPNTNDIILRGEARGTLQVPVSVTVHDPAMFAATVMAETFAQNGVQRTGTVKRDRTFLARKVTGADLIAVHETPITTVVARANKDSMNLYAECLCKRLGYDATGDSGSWANGTAAIGEFLKKVGVPEEQFNLDDGSGLSKQNVISPRAIAKVLAHEYHGRNKDAYLASLSIAGVDGTLEDRFKGSDLRGRVLGKSGFVNGVRSLSGIVRTKDGQHFAFSILMNHIPDDPTVKLLQEKIVKALDANASALVAGE